MTWTEETPTRERLTHLIEHGAIVSHFQPIMDLYFGETIGYEVLSRGEPPFAKPAVMLAKAKEWGLSWALERACRSMALKTIAALPLPARNKTFFLNVAPDIFSDRRFVNGLTLAGLNSLGLDQRQIVIEITEAGNEADQNRFEEIIRHYASQGFKIALDDFGAGQSGLVTLVRVLPHYLKLDHALVSEIQNHSYKQHLVKAIVSFADNVESKIIAEGVETVEELEVLLRLGVRYAQGYFLGRPAPSAGPVPQELCERVVKMARQFYYPHVSLKTSAAALTLRPPTFELGAMTCEGLHDLFKSDHSVDHVVMVAEGRPVSLLTRQHFYAQLGGPFGFSVFQRHFLEKVAKTDPLIVNQHVEITLLGRLAMERGLDDLYDPVIVKDSDGRFCGTITMKQLLTRSMDLELKRAASANPLTHLPGNLIIQSWLLDAMTDPPFVILYVDLDRFKEYNDSYGFPRGDEMIMLVAALLKEHAPHIVLDGHVGHIGGDDFVIVAKSLKSEEALRTLCRKFDESKLNLFNREHGERGFYLSFDRRGCEVEVPLATLSVAVVTDRNVSANAHPAQLGEVAASVKKKVKDTNLKNRCSGYLIDQRSPEAQ